MSGHGARHRRALERGHELSCCTGRAHALVGSWLYSVAVARRAQQAVFSQTVRLSEGMAKNRVLRKLTPGCVQRPMVAIVSAMKQLAARLS